jgi:hypothetical protein
MNTAGLAPYGSNPYDFSPADYNAYLMLLAQSRYAPAAPSAGQPNPYEQPDSSQDQGSRNTK